jgi:hypothetical protein
MYLLVVPPLTPVAEIPNLLDTVRYRVTHIAVGTPSSERMAMDDQMGSSAAVVRHYLYIFYDDAVPTAIAQLIAEQMIAEKDRRIAELETTIEGRAKAYRETHGGIC